MAHRVFNFNPGPSTLPLEVLKKVQEELLDYKGTGMSVMEISHRSAEYEEINDATIALVRELMGLNDKYHVLFMTGGASTQFALVPMNFAYGGKLGAYVDTGAWSDKAIKEAKILGGCHVVASSKADQYRYIPKEADIKVPADAAYLHITTNNTIFGTQWQSTPNVTGVPLIADMSSDILSRRWEYSKYAMLYGGAQKNLGPSGLVLVVIHDDLLQKCKNGNPSMFDYRTHAKEKSLYNTPPSLTVYVMRLVLEWIKGQGGLTAVEKVNRAKQEKIYGLIDKYPDFFKGTVDKGSRSWMNINLRLPNEDLEKKFVSEAKKAGFIGLKGHRSVGGIRVSLYNAMTIEGADKLAGFMMDFKKANG